MKYHPDAALLPMMTESEFAALVDDIRKNGLREPIKLDHTGEWLIDGRHRDRACPEAGVEPRYERLPEGTDILAYIMSANLHRRHLTDQQKADLVAEVIRRNPEKSNREIARIAKVSHTWINKVKSGGNDFPPDAKVIGADGKSYPAAGKTSPEKTAAIIADVKANPTEQKAIAERHGVSVNVVAGIRNRMRQAGELSSGWGMPAPPRKKQESAAPPPPADFKTWAAQMAARRAPPFDRLSREERGMGPKEYGAEQHPDWPEGWTRDDVFRHEHGRVQIFTEAQRAQNEVMKRFLEIIKPLRIIRELPDPEELDKLTPQQQDQIETHVERYAGAAIAKLQALLAKAQRRRGRTG